MLSLVFIKDLSIFRAAYALEAEESFAWFTQCAFHIPWTKSSYKILLKICKYERMIVFLDKPKHTQTNTHEMGVGVERETIKMKFLQWTPRQLAQFIMKLKCAVLSKHVSFVFISHAFLVV